MKDTVIIITGGTVGEKTFHTILKMYPDAFRIGVDHGLDVMDANGIIPDIAIGDFDSACPNTKEKYQKLHIRYCLIR